MRVNVATAKNKLTQLIRAAEKGERVTILRHGRAIVDIVPTGTPARNRAVSEGVMFTNEGDFEKWLSGG
jgi:prevent-host-death family protein